MTDQKQAFEQKNGMAIEKAWEMIEKWISEGNIADAKAGVQEILNFFPEDTKAQFIFQKSEQEIRSAFEQAQAQTLSPEPQKKSMTQKAQQQVEKMKQMNSGNEGDLRGHLEDADKLLGAGCYLHLFVILPLMMKKDSEFVQFHAWQGLVLSVIFTGIHFLLGIFSPLGFFFRFLQFFIGLAFLGLYIWGSYQAYQGVWNRLPGIYDISVRVRKLFEEKKK